MKKWLRRILIAAALVGLTLGILYECATHIGRGWLLGEAFYDGRPTSYWRSQVDRWVAEFDSPEVAEKSMSPWFMRVKPGEDGQGWWGQDSPVVLEIVEPDERGPHFATFEAVGRRESKANRLWRLIRMESGTSKQTPDVLRGFAEAEPVWAELERDAKYLQFTQRAKRNREWMDKHVPSAWLKKGD
jgi:hypothetical protein